MTEVNLYTKYGIAKEYTISNKFNKESIDKLKVAAQELYDSSPTSGEELWLSLKSDDINIIRAVIEQLGDKVVMIDFLYAMSSNDVLDQILNLSSVQEIFKNKEQGKKYVIKNIRTYERYLIMSVSRTQVINHILCLLLETDQSTYSTLLLEIGFTSNKIESIIKSKNTYYFAVNTETNTNLVNCVFNNFLSSQLPPDIIDTFMTHVETIHGNDILSRIECTDASWYKKLWCEYQLDVSPFFYIILGASEIDHRCCKGKNTFQIITDKLHIQDPLLKQVYGNDDKRKILARDLIVEYLSIKFNIDTKILDRYRRMVDKLNI